MSDELDSGYCVIIKSNQGYLLMMMKTGNKTADGKNEWMVHGFKTETDGIRFFESGYNANHGRSYEASMSACINWMFFSPSVIPADFARLKALTDGAKLQVMHLNNVAGSMQGILLRPEIGEAAWEAGAKPQLITPR